MDVKQILEALTIGRDAAQEVANDYHAKMKGYRQARHDAMDEDVAKIDAAIAALSQAVSMVPISQTLSWCKQCGEGYYGVCRAGITGCPMIATAQQSGNNEVGSGRDPWSGAHSITYK